MSYETEGSNSKLNYKIDEIILDYRMLFCRDPQPEEVALEASITPERAEAILEKLSLKEDWRRPTKIEKQKAQKKAKLRLELASWLKIGCRNLSYLKAWSDEEFSKAETISNQYEDCLPKIRRHKKNDFKNQTQIVLFWPELSWPIIGEPKIGAKFFEGKISDQTTIVENKSIPKNQLNECLEKIPILEETE